MEKGNLLFAMDSSDAQNRVDQASISVSQAKIAYQQASEAANPTATISGTINELYVHNGDSVSMGSPIAKLISSRDLTVDFLFPYAKPTDFYVGQLASVYVGNFDAPVDGTVESVSNETTLTSNGMNSVSVRVKIDQSRRHFRCLYGLCPHRHLRKLRPDLYQHGRLHHGVCLRQRYDSKPEQAGGQHRQAG